MKFFLIILVLLLVVWCWRNYRSSQKSQKKEPTSSPVDMVRCAHCGLHLPAAEALTGTLGSYCSADHKNAAEPS